MNKCVLNGLKKKGECYGLNEEAHSKMMEEHKCGTERCPFYKTEQEQIQQEETCRQRLVDIDYTGTHYQGIYHGLVTGKR